jgi:hypothetical protein
MATLTELREKSPEVAINGLEVIAISGDDAEDTDEEYEFEDVLGVDTTARMDNAIRPGAEEDLDDADSEGIQDGAASNAQADVDSVACVPEAVHDWEISDERVAPDATPRDNPDELNSVVYNEGNNDSRLEAVHLDRNGVDSGTSTSIVEVGNTVRDLAVEVAALRDRVAELEAQLHLKSVACQSTTPSKKRKRSALTSCCRRAKAPRTVNISATRAYVYWDESSDLCTYTWKRGRTGYCWVSDEERERGEEFCGESLLCSTSISIEVRANGDWLPIKLCFNEDTEMFEAQASFGRRRLEVDFSVVMHMMCGGKGEHVASVLYD